MAGAVLEVIRTGSAGSRFPAIKTEKSLALGIPVEHECAATDPRRLRLDEIQDELRRDCRIGGIAAILQDLIGRLSGEGVRSDRHEVFCADRFLVLPPG